MIDYQIKINIFLIIIGFIGIFTNYKNLLISLLGIELILLGVSLTSIFYSLQMDDILGQLLSIYILVLAGCESAIGLSILVLFYRIKGELSLNSMLPFKN
jgi:NADH-ubiquinone oxidoreductase chain 4L